MILLHDTWSLCLLTWEHPPQTVQRCQGSYFPSCQQPDSVVRQGNALLTLSIVPFLYIHIRIHILHCKYYCALASLKPKPKNLVLLRCIRLCIRICILKSSNQRVVGSDLNRVSLYPNTPRCKKACPLVCDLIS